MALDSTLRNSLTLPIVCAPMFLVSGPDLVREACKAGVIGALPRQNARTLDQFEDWMRQIHAELTTWRQSHPDARVAPLAVNLATRLSAEDLAANLAIVEALLAGRGPAGLTDTIALNSAVALWITGKTASVREGVPLARELLLGGAVKSKIAATREFYRS